MAISIRDTHRCIERSTDCNCPICGDYMFTSPQTVVFMPCGHTIHRSCYSQHIENSYKCPICSRSMFNMERQFLRLRQFIESQPMPPEFQDTKAWVYCNDCSAKTMVPYHWLGVSCAVYVCHIPLEIGLAPNSHQPDAIPTTPCSFNCLVAPKLKHAYHPL